MYDWIGLILIIVGVFVVFYIFTASGRREERVIGLMERYSLVLERISVLLEDIARRLERMELISLSHRERAIHITQREGGVEFSGGTANIGRDLIGGEREDARPD